MFYVSVSEKVRVYFSDPVGQHELFAVLIDLNQTGVSLGFSFNSSLMTIPLNHVDNWSLEC